MKGKRFEELTLKDDFMFGIVMRNERLCRMCLERILNVRIEKLVYPEAQKSIDVAIDAKSIRLDIYTKDDHTLYNVEMQNHKIEAIPKRGRYYQDLMDLDNLKKGEDYEKLKKNIVIFICTFDFYGEGRHLYSFRNRCDQDPTLEYGDETQKYVLNTKGTMDDIPPALKRFLDYIDSGEVSDEYTKDLDLEVENVRSSKNWRLAYMTYEMKLKEEREFAWKEGLEQGIERGEYRMLATQISKKLSRGKTPEEIAEDLEEDSDTVNRICEALKAASNDVDAALELL